LRNPKKHIKGYFLRHPGENMSNQNIAQSSSDVSSFVITETEQRVQLEACIRHVQLNKDLNRFPVNVLSRAVDALSYMPHKEWPEKETTDAFKSLLTMIVAVFEARDLKIKQNKISVKEGKDDAFLWTVCAELFQPIKNHLDSPKEEKQDISNPGDSSQHHQLQMEHITPVQETKRVGGEKTSTKRKNRTTITERNQKIMKQC